MDMLSIIKTLSVKRPLFHSEKDFQFSLAWEIKSHYPNSDIRLEVPCSGINGSIDIIVSYNGCYYPIELKYKKYSFSININNEAYNLAKDFAKTQNSPAFIRDIYRVEKQSELLNDGKMAGFVIWLTNDHTYWNVPKNLNVKYSPFFVYQGASITGIMANANESIEIVGNYLSNWRDYYTFQQKYGMFKYALFEIK